ncbi:riboflavin kinase [Aureococcus anophagefferens]|nr:riboflavin kinase [Aureococcus anophagefferens]
MAALSAVCQRSLQALQPPAKLAGTVVHGFGRGSAQLGFPTANLAINWAEQLDTLTDEERDVRRFVDENRTGIYAAWAQVASGADRGVYKVAMSADFYDQRLKLVVVGYVRPELKFDSFDELIREIRADGDFCGAALDGHAAWPADAHFAAP